MTLEQAKETLEERVKIDRTLRDKVESDFDEFCENECVAIDTVLKALQEYEKQLDLDYVRENYIPKEKVKEKIEEIISANPENQDWDGTDYTATPEEDFAIEKLEELL